MAQYMIQFPHTQQECLQELDELKESQLLNNIEWGCMSGEHTGWALLDAPSLDEVKKMIPIHLRENAHITEVQKFTVDQIANFHKQYT